MLAMRISIVGVQFVDFSYVSPSLLGSDLKKENNGRRKEHEINVLPIALLLFRVVLSLTRVL